VPPVAEHGESVRAASAAARFPATARESWSAGESEDVPSNASRRRADLALLVALRHRRGRRRARPRGGRRTAYCGLGPATRCLRRPCSPGPRCDRAAGRKPSRGRLRRNGRSRRAGADAGRPRAGARNARDHRRRALTAAATATSPRSRISWGYRPI